MNIELALLKQASQMREFLKHKQDLAELKEELPDWLNDWAGIMEAAQAEIEHLKKGKMAG